MNNVIHSSEAAKRRPIRDFEGGTIVQWPGSNRLYVVASNMGTEIGAVCLIDGGFLSPIELVTPVSEGGSITLTVGKVRLRD